MAKTVRIIPGQSSITFDSNVTNISSSLGSESIITSIDGGLFNLASGSQHILDINTANKKVQVDNNITLVIPTKTAATTGEIAYDDVTRSLISGGVTGGTKGATGATGATGGQGPTTNGVGGEKGIQGPKGPQGPSGPKGQKGEGGEPGANGAQGPQGAIGDKGPQGVSVCLRLQRKCC